MPASSRVLAPGPESARRARLWWRRRPTDRGSRRGRPPTRCSPIAPARSGQRQPAGQHPRHVDRALEVEVDHLVEAARPSPKSPMTPSRAMPASLIRTSMRPEREAVSLTKASACSASETSTVLKWKRSLSSRSSSQAGDRVGGAAGAGLDAVVGVEKGLHEAGPEAAATSRDRRATRGVILRSTARSP